MGGGGWYYVPKVRLYGWAVSWTWPLGPDSAPKMCRPKQHAGDSANTVLLSSDQSPPPPSLRYRESMILHLHMSSVVVLGAQLFRPRCSTRYRLFRGCIHEQIFRPSQKKTGLDPLGRLVANAGGMETQHGHMLRLHRRGIVRYFQSERREGT